MLNVSRPSVREALKALSLLGAIENRHGDGTYLSASTSQRLSEPFSILFTLNKGTLFDIFEARKILEVGVVALAAKRRNEEDIKAIEKALKEMWLNIRDTKEYGQNDIRFHQAIADATGNVLISDLMGKLYKLLFIDTKYHELRYGPDTVTYREQVCRDHEGILECIVKGDGQKAVQAMMDHLMNFEQRLKDEQDNPVQG
jgi:GntR family transcriptional repressor for pyruvate dehydrogenase complex